MSHSSIANQKIPAVIEALADERVVYIACGGSSSAAITGDKFTKKMQEYLLNIRKEVAMLKNRP